MRHKTSKNKGHEIVQSMIKGTHKITYISGIVNDGKKMRYEGNTNMIIKHKKEVFKRFL